MGEGGRGTSGGGGASAGENPIRQTKQQPARKPQSTSESTFIPAKHSSQLVPRMGANGKIRNTRHNWRRACANGVCRVWERGGDNGCENPSCCAPCSRRPMLPTSKCPRWPRPREARLSRQPTPKELCRGNCACDKTETRVNLPARDSAAKSVESVGVRAAPAAFSDLFPRDGHSARQTH